MFDWFSLTDTPIAAVSEPDAMDLLKNDHDSVKGLFDRFKKAGNRRSKAKIAAEALAALKIHALLEEEIFYPAVRAQVGRAQVGKDLMNAADEEHHIANLLIAELEEMGGHGDHFDAKFSVLAENVRRHIQEEESQMLPKAQGLDIDFVKLGRRMLRRREQLLVNGFPRKKPATRRNRARA
jgi:hypothetical protein